MGKCGPRDERRGVVTQTEYYPNASRFYLSDGYALESVQLGGFGEAAMDLDAALKSMERVESIIEGFFFLNVVAGRAEKLPCAADDGALSLRDQRRDSIHIALQQGCNI
jgi:hypothetical protein